MNGGIESGGHNCERGVGAFPSENKVDIITLFSSLVVVLVAAVALYRGSEGGVKGSGGSESHSH